MSDEKFEVGFLPFFFRSISPVVRGNAPIEENERQPGVRSNKRLSLAIVIIGIRPDSVARGR